MLRKGFSLIELLVVVAIIGILASIGSVGYSKYIESSRVTAARANVKLIADALTAANVQALSGKNINENCKPNYPYELCFLSILSENQIKNPFTSKVYITNGEFDKIKTIYVENSLPTNPVDNIRNYGPAFNYWHNPYDGGFQTSIETQGVSLNVSFTTNPSLDSRTRSWCNPSYAEQRGNLLLTTWTNGLRTLGDDLSKIDNFGLLRSGPIYLSVCLNYIDTDDLASFFSDQKKVFTMSIPSNLPVDNATLVNEYFNSFNSSEE